MATDVAPIIENLTSFYDFGGKVVVSVGAGGGQLIEYARTARHVFAVDSDAAAVEKLKAHLGQSGLEQMFAVACADFLAVSFPADVVLFEFCLHEIPDPAAAIGHARTMAKDVVVIDHADGSEWSFYTAEAEKIAGEWRAVREAGTRRHLDCRAVQRFADFAELHEKLKVLGPPATERILRYRDDRDFTIDMPYAIALLA